MRKPLSLALLIALACLPIAAQTDSHDDDRQALLRILTNVEKSINDQDVEGIISQMTPDCTVTWWNAEISRGADEIRAYYRRMMKDPGRIISKYTTKSKLGGHARFVGAAQDVALAEGSMEDEFFPIVRGPFKLNSRWSSTVVKTGAGWKIASLHLSSNVFTNTLIAELERAVSIASAGALAFGLLLGWFLTRRFSGHRRK